MELYFFSKTARIAGELLDSRCLSRYVEILIMIKDGRTIKANFIVP
jgi:hypothetical protein